MNDTHKLLLAFIEASGFEVKRELEITYGQPISSQVHHNRVMPKGEFKMTPASIDQEAVYQQVFRENKFTVTKKAIPKP